MGNHGQMQGKMGVAIPAGSVITDKQRALIRKYKLVQDEEVKLRQDLTNVRDAQADILYELGNCARRVDIIRWLGVSADHYQKQRERGKARNGDKEIVHRKYQKRVVVE